MNETEISQYITALEGVDVVTDSGNNFFFYNPDPAIPPDHRFPFTTLVTNDLYDQFSNLDRPSVFRLNIGIGKQTFRSLFGETPLPTDSENGDAPSGYDFTALDQVMPHPVYSRQYWVSVLNPTNETLETHVRPLLAEAHELEVSKYKRHTARK